MAGWIIRPVLEPLPWPFLFRLRPEPLYPLLHRPPLPTPCPLLQQFLYSLLYPLLGLTLVRLV